MNIQYKSFYPFFQDVLKVYNNIGAQSLMEPEPELINKNSLRSNSPTDLKRRLEKQQKEFDQFKVDSAK